MSSTALLTLPADRLSAPSLTLAKRPRFGVPRAADASGAPALRAVEPCLAADAADTPAAAVSRPRVRRLVVFTGQLS